MTYSFNLADEKWIPCVAFDGQVDELSLFDALAEAHRYRELGGESPLVTAALYRLLLAVLHRVFGPEGRDEWRALWARGRWDEGALDAYLGRWRHRFDLFDAQSPFCQADYPKISANRVGDLLHELSKGDTFYDHRTLDGVALMPAEAGRHLLAAQLFGRWMTKGPYGQLPFGTCARGIVFLAKGHNLFEDLALNLIRYPTQGDILPHTNEDMPCWEMAEAFTPFRTMPLGYLDHLTWLSRRVLLIPEDVRDATVVRMAKIAPGLRMLDDVFEPMMPYRDLEKRGGKGWVSYREERAVWRDSTAFFRVPQVGRADTAHSRAPAAFAWLASLTGTAAGLTSTSVLRAQCFGVSGDLNQYRVHFYRQEELPLPLGLLESKDGVDHLEAALGEAEEVRKQLWGALTCLASFVLAPSQDTQGGRKPDPKDVARLLSSWAAERYYWSALELPFATMIVDLTRDAQAARQAWQAMLRTAARRALDRAADGLGDEPSALKAAVLARGQLGAGLSKALVALGDGAKS